MTISMAVNISADEQEQILQTINMFEVITEMNPDDYQSLLLLKEAYGKLGRNEETVKTSCQIVEAYMRLEQLDNAGHELESLLGVAPDNDKVKDLLTNYQNSGGQEIQVPSPGSKKSKIKKPKAEPPPLPEADLVETSNGFEKIDFSAVASADTSLTEIDKTSDRGESHGIDFDQFSMPEDDSLEPLADFLLNQNLATPEAVKQALQHARNSFQNVPETTATSLLLEVIKQGTSQDEEQILLSILDHTKLGFVPLESYDIDRQVVKMIPRELSLGRLFVPFELISRTIMIAIGNPFDAPGKQVCQSLLDYNIKWYFARPDAIDRTLRKAYKVDQPQ